MKRSESYLQKPDKRCFPNFEVIEAFQFLSYAQLLNAISNNNLIIAT